MLIKPPAKRRLWKVPIKAPSHNWRRNGYTIVGTAHWIIPIKQTDEAEIRRDQITFSLFILVVWINNGKRIIGESSLMPLNTDSDEKLPAISAVMAAQRYIRQNGIIRFRWDLKGFPPFLYNKIIPKAVISPNATYVALMERGATNAYSMNKKPNHLSVFSDQYCVVTVIYAIPSLTGLQSPSYLPFLFSPLFAHA